MTHSLSRALAELVSGLVIPVLGILARQLDRWDFESKFLNHDGAHCGSNKSDRPFQMRQTKPLSNLLTYQVFFFSLLLEWASPFPNVSYKLYATWMHKMNPTDWRNLFIWRVGLAMTDEHEL